MGHPREKTTRTQTSTIREKKGTERSSESQTQGKSCSVKPGGCGSIGTGGSSEKAAPRHLIARPTTHFLPRNRRPQPSPSPSPSLVQPGVQDPLNAQALEHSQNFLPWLGWWDRQWWWWVWLCWDLK